MNEVYLIPVCFMAAVALGSLPLAPATYAQSFKKALVKQGGEEGTKGGGEGGRGGGRKAVYYH